MKSKLQRITMVCPDQNKHRSSLDKLYDILLKINPQKTLIDIRDYYFKCHVPELMTLVLITAQELIIGSYSVTAYTYQIGKNKLRVLRTAIGLMEQYRGQRLSPVDKLCSEFIRYKITHPFCTTVGVFFIENPLVYAMIAKRVKYLFPRTECCEPDTIKQIRREVLKIHAPEEICNDLVLRIYFKVFFTEEDKARINQSEDSNLRFYLDLNPNYSEGYSLLTILPVSWCNIAYCLWYMVFHKLQYMGKRAYSLLSQGITFYSEPGIP